MAMGSHWEGRGSQVTARQVRTLSSRHLTPGRHLSKIQRWEAAKNVCAERAWMDTLPFISHHLCLMGALLLLLSHSVMSDSLQPHGLQHARLPCPSLSPGAWSHSCPLKQWCQPTVSTSVTPFCPQSFPALGSFPVSQLFTSGGQIIGTYFIKKKKKIYIYIYICILC